MSRSFNPALSLFETAQRAPDRPALVQGRTALTYGNLARRGQTLADRLAPALKTKRIGILGSRSAEAYVAIAGICMAGATYVPLNMKWPAERLIKLMGELDLDALVLDGSGEKLLTDDVRAAAPDLIIHRSELMTETPLREPVQRMAEETGYIVFTSGTTGEPKGVVVSCGSLAEYLDNTRGWAGFTHDDRVAEAHDITFDLSIHNLFLAWEAGSCLHIMSPLDMMAPQRFIRANAITCWMSVPTIIAQMRQIDALKEDVFPTLRLSVFCGEPLPLAAVRAWAKAAPNSVIENIYGPTEGTVVCTRQRFTEPPVVTESRQIIAIGAAYDNFEIAICGPDGRALPDGETGEIAISSSQLSDGYFNRPELNAKAFRMIEGKRWYFTGDLGMRDGNGVLHHMGRADNQVKMKGNRIELEEVEMHLRRACGTDLAAVVAWPVVDGSAQGLVGFIAGDGVDIAAVRREMAKTLPDYMVPGRLDVLAELPRNINDKIDRKALVATLDRSAVTAPDMLTPLRTGADA